MKSILFVDKYPGIRESLRGNIDESDYPGYDITLVSSLKEAEKVFSSEKFDGMIIDGLQEPLDKMITFAKKIRAIASKQPLLALISTADFGLNSEEKKRYLIEKVSVANKVQALSSDNILELFNASCHRGYGEEICFQADTRS